MKMGSRESNIHSITRIVLIGAIGIIALAFGWAAINQSTETRSKAALAEKIYKIWEFKGSAEGWVGENSTALKSSADTLVASFPGNTGASIRQDLVNTALPYGNKYVKIVLSLTPGVARVLGQSDDGSSAVGGYVEGGAGSGVGVSSQGPGDTGWLSPEEINNAQPIGWPNPNQKCTPVPPCLYTSPYCQIAPPENPCPIPIPKPSTSCKPVPPCLYTSPYCELELPPGNWCSFPTPIDHPPGFPTLIPTPQPGVTMFDLTLLYQLTGKTTWEKPVVKTGLVSKGAFAEYAMLLSGISPLTVAKLKLQVSNVNANGIVSSENYTLRIDRIRLVGPVVPKPSISPKPTCTPEPPCLYSEPACAIDPPVPPGGWCPRVTPTPTRRPTPTPTCTPPPPPCTSGPCPLYEPAPPRGGWCPHTPTPKPTCTPEPPCIYSPPYCELELPVPPGGWCTRPTPTPTRRPTPTPTRRPTPRPTPTVLPTSGARILYETPSAQGKHWTCAFFPNGFWCK